MSKSREQLVQYLSEINIEGKVVLDCGAGDRSKWARNFTKGEPKEYITVDYNREFNPDMVGDLNRHPAHWKVMKGELTSLNMMDVVFCLEVLEHLWKPRELLQIIYGLILKKGGKLYLSTPFINPYHDEVDYARYTSEWYEKVLTYVGFKDIKIKPRLATEGLPHLLQFYKLEGLRMSKTRLQKGQQNKMAEIGYFVIASK